MSKLPKKSLACLIILLSLYSSTSRDTLTPSQPLSDGEILISSGGTFALGFFTPAYSTNNNRYIGVWYNKIPGHAVIWVANRRNPINSTTGILSITANGSLVITDGNSVVIWLFSSTTQVANPIAQLLDTGNFIVVEYNDLNSIAWQGFDYPTDTLVPGMKLGWDRKSGLNRNVTGWSSSTDPSPGNYTFGVDLHGDPQLILWAGSVRQWRSGPWNGIPPHNDLNSTATFSFIFVDNEEEVSYTVDVVNKSTLTRLVVNPSGNTQRFVLLDSGQWGLYWYLQDTRCDLFGVCGPNSVCYRNASPMCSCLPGFEPKLPQLWASMDYSGGCIRKTELDCRNGSDGFMTMQRMLLPDTMRATVDMRLRLDDCRAKCLRNCSCNGFSSANIHGTGCITWSTDLLGLVMFLTGGQEFYLRLAAADLDEEKRMLLDWGRRYQIILGIARGLLYLHQDSRFRIIHRDLKASNVLLDKDMNPKISDFGLARTFGGDETKTTRRIVGTYGYMSPEYALNGIFSVKSDVFSFGVLVLEIISGKRNNGVYFSQDDEYLLAEAWVFWNEDIGLQLVDASLDCSFSVNEVLRCIRVGLLCVQECPEDRPTMSSVVMMLSSEHAFLPEPKKPGYLESFLNENSSSKNGKLHSVNDVTITMPVGR